MARTVRAVKQGNISQQKYISSFKLQPYLYTIKILKYRYAMPKLRMSSHRLHIETGRWIKPRNERTRIYCNVIEDEFHFVLECKLFEKNPK